jgi:tRNA dimethylallyltransferase
LVAARHYFVDYLSVSDDYSVGDFERDALATLEKIFAARQTAILVGGSGLYLRAVCEGLDAFPDVRPETRMRVAEGESAGGLAWLQAELARRDPAYFAAVDQQNPARLRRALEVCFETGAPYSDFRGKNALRRPRPFRPIYLLLDLPRPALYARIEARVDAMLAAGLEAEARALLPWRHRPALRTVGYEEFFDHFDGEITREEAVDKIKQHSRNYAKRQATWFRKHGEWTAFEPGEAARVVAFLEEKMKD